MGQGATLEFYDADEFSSYVEAKKKNAVKGVHLDYADKDTLAQSAVWDALEIIHAALSVADKRDMKLRYVLTRDSVILDC
jgi:hypothetical protein